MGIELNMDMGWTDTAHHLQHHRTQSFVNITTLSSLAAAPTQLLKVVERGAMDSFAQSVPFVESFRRCGFRTLGRVLSSTLEQIGRVLNYCPVLLRPTFLVWVLFLSLKTFFLELWLNLYLAQHYEPDSVVEWRAVQRDMRRWFKRNGSGVLAKILLPAWAIVGYVATALKVSAWSLFGWSPSASLMYVWLTSGGILMGWWFISKHVQDKNSRNGGLARSDGRPDSPESTSDEGKTPGKGAARAKRRAKPRKTPKKKKTVTF